MKTKQNILFRKAAPRDLDALCDLRAQLAHDPMDKQTTEYAPYSPQPDRIWINKCLHARNRVILIAERQNKILAHAIILIEKASPKMRAYYTYDKKALLVHLYVDENNRRQGIGSALMKYAFEYLKNLKVDFVDLECAPENDKALTLYNKMGFRDIWIKKRFKLS